MIKIEKLNKTYRSGRYKLRVLKDISLTVEEGEFVSIIGTSGSGKTTLLNLIGGLDTDYSGSIVIDNVHLQKLKDSKLSKFRNDHIGFVFQSFHLMPHLTCVENVILPSYFGTYSGTDTPKERAVHTLREIGLAEKTNERPTEMSGGQKQRVAISRALFNHPKIMLCDEPTGSLDRTTGIQILKIFKELNRLRNITILMVTHEEHISRAANRIIRLEDGEVISDEIVDESTLFETSGALDRSNGNENANS